MKTLSDVKKYISENIGNKVWIKVRGNRNKNEIVEGIINECHKNIFMVKTYNFNRSFSYVDILIGNIILNFK